MMKGKLNFVIGMIVGMMILSTTGVASAVAEVITATRNVSPIYVDGERVEVTGLTVTPKALKLQQGEQGRIIATVSPTNATNKSVAYSSSNTKVASVGTSGYVSANTPGTAVITVKASNNFTETVNVTVTGVVFPQKTKS